MSSPAWIWNVWYSSVDDLDNGVRNMLDGELHIWPAKKWVTLVDAAGSPIIGKFMRKDDGALEVGFVVEFSVYHALVDHCILSPPDLPGLDKGPVYDTSKTLDLATLRVSSKDRFHVGSKIRFTDHVVRLGTIIKSNPAVDDIAVKDAIPGQESLGSSKDAVVDNHFKAFLAQDPTQSDQDSTDSSSLAYAALFKDLDFSHGINFAKDVKNKFRKEVHPSSSSGRFLMVVAFGRATFKLEEDLVGIALEAAIGGICGQLKVSMIQDRVFSFTVSSKEVGFHILKLRKFSSLKKQVPKPILNPKNRANKKLEFAKNIGYEACLGYQSAVHKGTGSADPPVTLVTSSTPPITYSTTKPLPAEKISLNVDAVEHLNLEEPKDFQEDMSKIAQDDFGKMIDDMAYKFWNCGRCLSMGHRTPDCTNEIRCRSCFSYGHVRKKCLANKQRGKVWVPKRVQTGTVLGTGMDKEVATSGVAASASAPINDMLDTLQQFEHINLVSSPVSTSSSSSQTMAVFEVDPTPWLPWGHEIIDGGPTRLPRTFYFASQDPPPRYMDYCIALVDPPPPPAAMALWREQVHNFLVGPLQRNVVTSQPSLFGVGLYQMSSPNLVNALVQHGQYQIQNRLLRFVHVGEAPQNHRAALGFRRGWLMLLGVHPDYRNDFDIAQAVATFGQYHSWNNNDPVLDRVLVYASFPSPQLVPRDVVFGKFATVGGAKESWTAPVYILTAEFAEALPADEDQMPPDGNPHPFPGELQANNNLFVNPQFPEIGWDAVQDVGQDQQGNQGGPHGQHGNWGVGNNVQHEGWGLMNNEQQGAWEQGEVIIHDIQESMVINMSDSSGSSVNMMEVQQQQQVEGLQMLRNVLNIGMVHTVIGPALPPEMLYAQALQLTLPSWFSMHVPKGLSVPLGFLKKVIGARSVLDLQKGAQHFESFMYSDWLQVPVIGGGSVSSVDKRHDLQGVLQHEILIPRSKKRRAKTTATLVQSAERRFTRSCLKMDGYRPAPVLAVQPKIRKKVRAKNLLMTMEQEAVEQEKGQEEEQRNEEQATPVPPIPLALLQRVGHSLGIAPDRLSKEQLEAGPDGEQGKESPNE
ncbi:hypothetical protein QYE76_052460 [Lolium multiflorum]|uniref:CCHC-type domain-containing protein n=1 Tax=Lolium multiflorum TaxID=4521 RepID=A0AAD8WJI2_LOLMU|nr:hypothetical protein QYE76_052460 [Lolium multiflorum]